MQGKHDRVIDVLKRIAGINRKSLPVLRPNAQIEVIFCCLLKNYLSSIHFIVICDKKNV